MSTNETHGPESSPSRRRAPVRFVSDEEPAKLRFDRDEYYRIADAGLFQDKHVELMNGDIIRMSPQKSRHRIALALANQLFAKVLPNGFFLSVQSPLALGERTELEPDIAIIAGTPRDLPDDHPHTAALVVELSESSLQYDRTRKAAAYARAGLPDYWLVDLIGGKLEIRRQPGPAPEGRTKHGYAQLTVHGPDATVSPLFAPELTIRVSELLP